MTDNEKMLLNAISSFSSLIGGVEIKFYTDRFVSIFKNQDVIDTGFCQMVKSTPLGCKLCNECDKQALARARLMHTAFIYTCHLGLTEMIHPSFIEGKYVGSFFFGQFHSTGTDIGAKFKKYKKMFAKLGMPIEQAQKLYGELPVYDDKKINDIRTVLDLIAFYSAKNEIIKTENESYLDHIRDYIDHHLTEKITLKNIAEHLHLSPAYVSNLFSRKKGVTLFRFIQARRVNYACYLLRSTDKPINSICLDSGFSDQNYFARVFKEVMGTTAHDYRKQYNIYESKDFFLKI
ncbi:MAG: helix-turn-helix domain-containing protein [Clostridiales bacterium]|jgi:AraC-like DNA-binding protein|nr:helix-turn-helix domain-containing protein [Clostridiales bacterium]